jgi:signal transduction histidine kinase
MRRRRGGTPARTGGSNGPTSSHAEIGATLTHELRTPLATALMYMGVAEQAADAGRRGERIHTALAVARKQILRIERLVARVVELEQSCRPVLAPRRLDLARVITEAVLCARRVAGPSGRLISMNPDAGRIVGWWDDDAIEQILQNLLSNALKFGEGRPIQVVLTADPSGVAHLVVRDEGVGIASTDCEHIFRRHFHAPPERSGGLGLGLWLVRALAEAHGGGVKVSSRLGFGTTFDVSLRSLASQTDAELSTAQMYLGD